MLGDRSDSDEEHVPSAIMINSSSCQTNGKQFGNDKMDDRISGNNLRKFVKFCEMEKLQDTLGMRMKKNSLNLFNFL